MLLNKKRFTSKRRINCSSFGNQNPVTILQSEIETLSHETLKINSIMNNPSLTRPRNKD